MGDGWVLLSLWEISFFPGGGLWRLVVVQKYSFSNNEWVQATSSRAFGFLQVVSFVMGTFFFLIIHYSVQEGSRISFWNDVQCGGRPL